VVEQARRRGKGIQKFDFDEQPRRLAKRARLETALQYFEQRQQRLPIAKHASLMQAVLRKTPGQQTPGWQHLCGENHHKSDPTQGRANRD
jgi:hypothetical protein